MEWFLWHRYFLDRNRTEQQHASMPAAATPRIALLESPDGVVKSLPRLKKNCPIILSKQPIEPNRLQRFRGSVRTGNPGQPGRFQLAAHIQKRDLLLDFGADWQPCLLSIGGPSGTFSEPDLAALSEQTRQV